MKKVLFVLGELRDDDIEWLPQVGRKERLAAGTVLIREQAPVPALYIVLDGSLAAAVAGVAGGAVADLGAGEIVGEMSFLEDRPAAATVTASQDSVVLALPRAAIEMKLKEDLEFASPFYRALAIMLSSRLRTTMGRLSSGSPGPGHHSDELAESLLDSAQIGGARFLRILRRLSA